MEKKEDFPSFTYTLYINSSSESQKVREFLDSVPVKYNLVRTDDEEISLDIGTMTRLQGFDKVKEYFVGKED